MLVADLADIGQILQREGLAADQVGPGLHPHEGDPLGAEAGHHILQLGHVHIALEGIDADHFQAGVADDFLDQATIQRDVRLGGGEMVVHRHHRTFADQHLRQDVFTGTALVCRQEIVHAEDFLELAFQAGVRGAAGVAVVGNHHGRHLLVAHGVDTAVGEHVHEHIGILEQKGVVAGFRHRCQAPLNRRQIQLLNDADLVHFERKRLRAVELHFRHDG